MSANHTNNRVMSARNGLSALRQAQSPPWIRRGTRLLMVIFFLLPIGLIYLPWQQSLFASGRVVAFDPTQRQQEIESPVDGRIIKWHVKEGQRVKGPTYDGSGKLIKAGDPMVSIQDPDPDLPRRLAKQRQAVVDRTKAAKDRIASFKKQVAALEKSRTQAILSSRNRLQMGKERLKAAEQSLTVAELRRDLATTNFRMESALVDDGLTSRLNYLTAKQSREATLAETLRAANTRDAAKVEVKALESDVDKVINDTEAAVNSARASQQSAEAELASATRDLEDLEIRISRQSTQDVMAPCDGIVYRILANSSAGGTIVKMGERLLVLTPDILDPEERMVELFVEGNDAPQLTELWRERLRDDPEANIKVRLQFEGWPAIQFVGWPSIAWGTFGGKVVFVDPHDDGKGRFRVLVKQDPDDDPWPKDFTLRQGTRAQGWFLLNRVSLGYELWRRFNGFPPVIAGKDAVQKDGKKPGKVKVPK